LRHGVDDLLDIAGPHVLDGTIADDWQDVQAQHLVVLGAGGGAAGADVLLHPFGSGLADGLPGIALGFDGLELRGHDAF
jgi:hypothetical protein